MMIKMFFSRMFYKVKIHTSYELKRQNTEYKRYKLQRSHYQKGPDSVVLTILTLSPYTLMFPCFLLNVCRGH